MMGRPRKTVEPDDEGVVEAEGSAEAMGEHAYAGPRSDEVDDDRPDEAKGGTAAHLGDSPYAGSPGA
jgi:hypothetical protein